MAGHSKGQWARNKKDRTARQEALWGGREKIKSMKNYQTETLESVGGSKQKYRTRKDKKGRKYIMDLGGAAPAGYYSDGSRYYKLKKNARITDRSSDLQKAAWYANHAEILGVDPTKAGGYLDHAGRQGQIFGMGNGMAEVNLGKTQGGRKMMDKTKAYFEGWYGAQPGKAKSRYIFEIGQDGREA
jgi:hypothetical protein